MRIGCTAFEIGCCTAMRISCTAMRVSCTAMRVSCTAMRISCTGMRIGWYLDAYHGYYDAHHSYCDWSYFKSYMMRVLWAAPSGEECYTPTSSMAATFEEAITHKLAIGVARGRMSS